MNERIGKLAEKAGLLGPSSRIGNSHEAAERFAQLIIRECIDTLQRGRDNFGSNDPQILKGARDALTIAVYDIQNRFEMREDSKS
mgnify:CR=1 FL=1